MQQSLFANLPTNSNWVAPKDFPNLAAAKRIAIDCETYDPGIAKDMGPGVRMGGYIAGIAVGTDEQQWYFPIRHQLGSNMDADQVLRWARDELTRPHQPKVGTNLMYDLDYLAQDGVHVQGKPYDIQIAQPLLDENAYSYSLDTQARHYLGEGKVDNALYEWCAMAYGGKPDRKQAGNIYRAPAELVGPYAEGDVRLPLLILDKQRPLLEAEGLLDLFELETRLIPMMLAMRRNGVRFDAGKVDMVHDYMKSEEEAAQRRLNDIAGRHVDVWSNKDLALVFDRAGIAYMRTDKGNPSFPGDWLDNHDSDLASSVRIVRKWSKARSTFIDGYIRKYGINGRIHAEFHQMRSDDSGTVSGRFSSSNPNLQNIPARNPELNQLIRGLFIPEDGHQWRRYDWSQIEYRALVHYGIGESADLARAMYNENPDTDFHEMTQNMVRDIAGVDLGRKPTKNINFGLTYGMGVAKLSRQLGVSMEKGQELFEAYHEAVPFVKKTFDVASQRASSRGYIKTLYGRRRRFELWEPRYYSDSPNESPALPREQALSRYGSNIRRAFTHKALNSLLQGTAADIMKVAMVDIWESGVCDIIGPPLLTVHDELDFDDPMTPESEQAFKEIKHIMEHCVELKVPLLADEEMGPNWGELK